jgi:hypothetical protein
MAKTQDSAAALIELEDGWNNSIKPKAIDPLKVLQFHF